MVSGSFPSNTLLGVSKRLKGRFEGAVQKYVFCTFFERSILTFIELIILATAVATWGQEYIGGKLPELLVVDS